MDINISGSTTGGLSGLGHLDSSTLASQLIVVGETGRASVILNVIKDITKPKPISNITDPRKSVFEVEFQCWDLELDE